jgi:hypothetical protein
MTHLAASQPPVPRTRWVVPVMNPRRASLRYRCIYPMQELARRGRNALIWTDSEPLDASMTLVFDAWTLFTTTNSNAAADAVVSLAAQAKAKGARIVVDNCDNQFASASASDDWDRSLIRLRRLGELADIFVTCSQPLSDAMQSQIPGPARHVVVDDPIEEKIEYPGDSVIKSVFSLNKKLAWCRLLQLRAALVADKLAGRTPLVWFGSHGNHFAPGGMNDVLRLRSTLEQANNAYPISLTIISNQRGKFNANFSDWILPTRYLEWDRVTFLAALRLHEISIIPVADNEFTRCKSSNRLTLSIHHGLSVIADPIPSYLPYATVAALGNWDTNLDHLLANKAIRRSNGRRCREFVDAKNGLQQIASDWEALLFGSVSETLSTKDPTLRVPACKTPT